MTTSINNYNNLCTESYPYLEFRKNIWKEIVRYVQKDIGKINTLIDLGAGFCDFINLFPSEKKIGYELNPEMLQYVSKTVELRIEDSVELKGIEDCSVDLVFASNFMEHLNKTSHNLLLPRIRQILKSKGRLVLIQPNYNLCQKHYFDDKTHQTIFSDKNIGGFLENYGFSVKKLVPGFLPFSMKSRLPKWSVLVRLYLVSPIKPFAGQMYVVAERS